MTIRQTVDIPANRKVRFDVDLPETVPCGKAQVVLHFPSVAQQDDVSGSETPWEPGSAMEKSMKEAEEKWRYNQSHPEELRELIKRVQEGPPLFGGIGADEFIRRCRDEWD
jgi:histidinol-phosphate/aromatic aminotransferase/cobyric acid decarboxylase-like protein